MITSFNSHCMRPRLHLALSKIMLFTPVFDTFRHLGASELFFLAFFLMQFSYVDSWVEKNPKWIVKNNTTIQNYGFWLEWAHINRVNRGQAQVE